MNEKRRFEDEIASLLRDQGDISTEIAPGIERAVMTVSVRSLGHARRTAVFCLEQPITSEYVRHVESAFTLLQKRSAVDEALIVTPNPATTEELSLIGDLPLIRHMARGDLLASVIDFRPYMRSLITAWDERPDALSHYYIPLVAIEHGDLETKVMQWITAEDSSPIAILGSYGNGEECVLGKASTRSGRPCFG